MFGFGENGDDTLGSLKVRSFFRSRITISIQGKLTACGRFVTVRSQLRVFSNFFLTFKTVHYFFVYILCSIRDSALCFVMVSRLAQSSYSGVVSVLEKCLATRIFIELWL